MLVWALTWAIWLYATSGPAWVFLAIAIGGPIVAYVLYRVAVAQYRTLADLLRSSVDLFRLDLLAALQYQRPVSVDHERDLWNTIDAMHGLYEVRELPYVAPSKSS
jgi:predicted signal transduction protein with EAL and GGDEF domain